MSILVTPALDESERLFREYGPDDPFAAAMRGTRLAMTVVDCRLDDRPIVFANDAFLRLTGYERAEVLGRNCRFLQGPKTDPAAIAGLREAIDNGRDAAVELVNYRKDGRPFWNGLFVSPVKSADGDILYYFGSQSDVSEKKHAELALSETKTSLESTIQARHAAVEQKAVLLHEVEHRVKNNLQLVSSLIQFQARRVAEPQVRAALQQVQQRVSALATVHRRLFQTDDAARFDVAQFLHDLADDALGRAGSKRVAITLEAEPVQAVAAKAAPLALMLNEILTYMVERGFPPDKTGRLRIVARRQGDRVAIDLSDDGELSGDQARQALTGHSGIMEILRRQLGAEISWGDNSPGVRALISLPIEQ